MSAYAALVNREFLEHRSAFLWAAGIVLTLIVLAGLMVLRADVMMGDMSDADRIELIEKLGDDAQDVGGLETLVAMGLDVAGSTDAELGGKMHMFMAIIATPFHWLFVAIAVFALAGCLHDERKDQSVLWWKSMPVSDTATVLSKWAFVMLAAPLVTIIAVWIAQLFSLTIAMAFVEDGMGGRLWSASGILAYPFKMLFGYVLYSLWSLPVVAWIMLTSVAAPKAPMLWAVGVPWIVILLEQIFFDSNTLFRALGEHIFPFTMPFVSPEDRMTFSMFGKFSFWGGLIIGAGFMYATILLRGRNNAL